MDDVRHGAREPGSPPADARAGLALTLALASVSFAAVLIVLTRASPVWVAFGRLALAALFLGPFLAVRSVREAILASRRQLPAAALSGFLLGLHLLLWIASLRATSVAASMFLLSSQAVFALILSHTLLKEPVGPRGWFAVLLGIVGACLIVGGDIHTGRGMTGGILALLSALAFVFYLAAGRIGRRHMPNIPWLILVYSFASLVLLPFLPATRPAESLPWGREVGLWVLLALGPTILGHGLMNYALKFVRIHTVNLTVLAEPFLAVVWAWWLLGQRPGGWTWPGGALVITGCLLAWREEGERGLAARGEIPGE